jgi:hypothetical protein
MIEAQTAFPSGVVMMLKRHMAQAHSKVPAGPHSITAAGAQSVMGLNTAICLANKDPGHAVKDLKTLIGERVRWRDGVPEIASGTIPPDPAGQSAEVT